ncbi:hypothetical protein MFLAVUS_007357 [Mucor flavus]|uniref:F-box domain-containing protein n=1 Tax=Mucor flavus TaxID=439312 RepID=A0ABP9Z436_9FUNG
MTTNNMKWDTIPNEILKLIVSNCGRDCEEVKWMFVNKQWFKLYLSLIYNTISIDSATTDNKVDKILFSRFNVGEYVKNITFESFYVADSIEELDIASDCLSMLMKRTPNVKEVAFASGNTEWAYFSAIIISNEYWRLHVLPELIGENLSFSAQYYLCAYHMRDSLKKLTITLGMIGPRNYRYLMDFTAVETLCIGKGILASLYGLDLLLPYLPKLKALTAHFSNSRNSEQDEQKMHAYPHVKELMLINFTPKKIGEVLTLTKKCAYLNKLNIIGDEKTLWPSDNKGLNITEIFFKDFISVPEYLIKVTGEPQVTALTNNWLCVRKQSSRENYLSFQFNNGASQPISLAIKKDNSNPAVKFKYEGLTCSEKPSSLIWIDDTVSQVELINSNADTANIRARVIELLEKEHVNLKTLILTGCVFTSDAFPNTLLPEKQHLKRLEFDNCIFKLPDLTSFLSQFNSLDFVSLGSCSFQSVLLNEHIDMSTTSIGTLRISAPTLEETITGANYNYRNYNQTTTNSNTNYQTHIRAASVYLASRDLNKFYIIIDDNAVEATGTSFDSIITQYASNITVIRIKVRSIKELLLNSANSSEYIKITCSK